VCSLRVVDERLILIWKERAIPLSCLKEDLYFSTEEQDEELSLGLIREPDGSVRFIVLNGEPCERVGEDQSEPDSKRWPLYEGTYAGIRSTMPEQLTVTVKADRLFIRSKILNATLPCIPWGLTCFRCRLGTVSFDADAEGVAKRLRIGSDVFLGRVDRPTQLEP
jgi:hypothetical protein